MQIHFNTDLCPLLSGVLWASTPPARSSYIPAVDLKNVSKICLICFYSHL